MMMRNKAQEAKKSRDLYNESQELESLLRVFERLDKNGDKRVDADELYDCVKFLGYKSNKKEIQDMIWEVRARPSASPSPPRREPVSLCDFSFRAVFTAD